MRALAWLNKLRRDTGGNVLIITAAVMPLIIGGAGMAIDSVQLSVWKRQLQRAADSAAIAGAYGEARDAIVTEAVHRDLDENVFPILSVPEVVEVGPRLGFNRTVYVELTTQRTVPFMAFFTGTPTTITASATAALVDEGEFCMLSLYDGDDPGINANGNATVDLGCGMAANSTATNSVTAGGTSAINADPITSVGGLNGETENFAGDTVLRPYSAPTQDPFADVPDPTVPSGCDTSEDVDNGETTTLPAGSCRTSWNVGNGGTLILEPGVHYVNGGNIDLHGIIESTGDGDGAVTIVMTGTETNSDGDLIVGDLIQNGGGELHITASESGDYAGIALYRDRRASLLTVKINGGAETTIQGAIYMPSTDLWYGGNAVTNADCLQVVARIITFRGGANIGNSCPPGSASQMFRHTVVRLVG